MGIISDKFSSSIIFIFSGIVCTIMSIIMLKVPEIKEIEY